MIANPHTLLVAITLVIILEFNGIAQRVHVLNEEWRTFDRALKIDHFVQFVSHQKLKNMLPDIQRLNKNNVVKFIYHEDTQTLNMSINGNPLIVFASQEREGFAIYSKPADGRSLVEIEGSWNSQEIKGRHLFRAYKTFEFGNDSISWFNLVNFNSPYGRKPIPYFNMWLFEPTKVNSISKNQYMLLDWELPVIRHLDLERQDDLLLEVGIEISIRGESYLNDSMKVFGSPTHDTGMTKLFVRSSETEQTQLRYLKVRGSESEDSKDLSLSTEWIQIEKEGDVMRIDLKG